MENDHSPSRAQQKWPKPRDQALNDYTKICDDAIEFPRVVQGTANSRLALHARRDDELSRDI